MRRSIASSKKSPRDFATTARKAHPAQLLRRVDQQLLRLERRRRLLMMADRKREAREKFMLGGFVVRAGLSKADRAFLLGGLLELASVAPGSSEHRRLRDIGTQAFTARVLDDTSLQIGEAAE